MTFVGRDTLSTGVMPAEAGTQDTSTQGVSTKFDWPGQRWASSPVQHISRADCTPLVVLALR